MTTFDYEAERLGWMQTRSGRQFFPLNPTIKDIGIADIAAALSKICRYGGHTTKFYSVAEHSVLIWRCAAFEHKRAALLHDASEAYIGDVIRPLKKRLPQYIEAEDALMKAIAYRFGFGYPLHPSIKELDNRIIADERRQVMTITNVPSEKWGDIYPALGVTIEGWDPARAQDEFLAAFHAS